MREAGQTQPQQHHPEGLSWNGAEREPYRGEHQRNVPHRGPAKNTKKLLGPVAGKQEARYHTHQAVKMVRVSFQEGHALASLSLAVLSGNTRPEAYIPTALPARLASSPYNPLFFPQRVLTCYM